MTANNGILLVVAAALTDPHGRILVQRRSAGRAMAGLWEFPGGKVESGEAPEAALVRELAEELGVAVAAADLTALAFATAPIGERTLLLLLYRCERWSGAPRPIDADALDWRRPAALRDLAMPPADLPLVEALDAFESRRLG
ncbi:(deoxy)nucleoside triphosphate pyrophosphohydrolase [Sphingomonas sp. H39-1-10]|uniref:(deoxy)nucleoside triphosphate pyrophosphohydrolase n=1 Tax=Sphingomonas TaxID=13687 RepID=UPI00088056A4|nr:MULTISPECIES: (deoxy)nucleoside triphosphate pyrophosphohydrolase [Sphingomonas]MDF0488658.1 (deoxy)nucleoside triphosphate pyrophosphohydrolase [Sphingomonas pollutisoli]SDA12603.1 8-oxo-dGTP diphosphatase [Sphingomonas sp. NFR15]